MFCRISFSPLPPFTSVQNGALLTKFVSERGSILPKRFTKCCAKHQRKWVASSWGGATATVFAHACVVTRYFLARPHFCTHP